jgi:rSAM/selenodomain-associated transferase 1
VTRDALIVFVKAPRPGSVKTRLAAHVGAEAAAAVYRAIAQAVARQTAPRTDEYERLFFHAPADAGRELAEWLPGETLVPQVEGDLGVRMAAAFADVFARGAPRVAMIGSDVPDLATGRVREALAALQDHDLALGPARDGGYYLLSLSRPVPILFDDIPWSTPGVLQATLMRADSLGLRTRMLKPMRDVDTLEDLRAEWGSVSRLVDPATRGAIEAVLAAG